MHAGVDERLHEQEHIGRTGTGEGRRHIDLRLLGDLELFAQRAEDRFRAGLVIALHRRARAPHRDAHPDLRGRVRHRADDDGVLETFA